MREVLAVGCLWSHHWLIMWRGMEEWLRVWTDRCPCLCTELSLISVLPSSYLSVNSFLWPIHLYIFQKPLCYWDYWLSMNGSMLNPKLDWFCVQAYSDWLLIQGCDWYIGILSCTGVFAMFKAWYKTNGWFISINVHVPRPVSYGYIPRSEMMYSSLLSTCAVNSLVGLVVKASALRTEDPGFESCLRRDFFRVESYQWLKNWHSSGYPARRLAL